MKRHRFRPRCFFRAGRQPLTQAAVGLRDTSRARQRPRRNASVRLPETRRFQRAARYRHGARGASSSAVPFRLSRHGPHPPEGNVAHSAPRAHSPDGVRSASRAHATVRVAQVASDICWLAWPRIAAPMHWRSPCPFTRGRIRGCARSRASGRDCSVRTLLHASGNTTFSATQCEVTHGESTRNCPARANTACLLIIRQHVAIAFSVGELMCLARIRVLDVPFHRFKQQVPSFRSTCIIQLAAFNFPPSKYLPHYHQRSCTGRTIGRTSQNAPAVSDSVTSHREVDHGQQSLKFFLTSPHFFSAFVAVNELIELVFLTNSTLEVLKKSRYERDSLLCDHVVV